MNKIRFPESIMIQKGIPMKIGLTSYSMNNYICGGLMSVCEVMRFAKEKGAEHIELVPFGFTLHDDKTGEFNEPLIAEILRVSREIDLPLSNYAVLGDLLKEDPDARKRPSLSSQGNVLSPPRHCRAR